MTRNLEKEISWRTLTLPSDNIYFATSYVDFFKPLHQYLVKVTEEQWVPGVNIVVAQEGKMLYQGSYGNVGLIEPYKQANSIHTLYDIASLTKVTATWPAILFLVQNGLLSLDDQVSDHLPESTGFDVGNVTISHLLSHTGGLPAGTYVKQYGLQKEEIIKGILQTSLENRPGQNVIYSNRGFILLGLLVERITAQPLDEFVNETIWKPLHMKETCFNPIDKLRDSGRIAPTECVESKECLHGVVHDENARLLDGIAGHAGVFSTLHDMARFCGMVMGEGTFHGGQLLEESIVRQSLKKQTGDLEKPRGYGWDFFSPTVIGHLGFTGTSILIHRELNAFVILLTNRVHPSRENKHIKSIREHVHSYIWDGLRD